MKKVIIVCFFLGFWNFVFSQNADSVYFIIPKQFPFQNAPNQHNINTVTKFLLEKKNKTCVWSDNIAGQTNPCNGLKINLLNNSNLFTTKLVLTLTDCKNQVVFTSKEGKSREKNYKKSYKEALTQVIDDLDRFNETTLISKEETKVKIPANPLERIEPQSVMDMPSLFAKETPDGYQLFDKDQKIVFSLQKTSLENIFQAIKTEENIIGIFFKKDDLYVFEFNNNGKKEQNYYKVIF